jgi:hypothetical protein
MMKRMSFPHGNKWDHVEAKRKKTRFDLQGRNKAAKKNDKSASDRE